MKKVLKAFQLRIIYQLFANKYLNELEHFVKEKLRVLMILYYYDVIKMKLEII